MKGIHKITYTLLGLSLKNIQKLQLMQNAAVQAAMCVSRISAPQAALVTTLFSIEDAGFDL